MIPEFDPDGAMDPDEWDAACIAQMADEWEASPGIPALALESGWLAEDGRYRWCWENPAAWEILDGDVDRVGFARQVKARNWETLAESEARSQHDAYVVAPDRPRPHG